MIVDNKNYENIDYSKIAINPIENFNNLILKSLDEVIKKELNLELKQSQVDTSQIDAYTKKIFLTQQEIISEKKAKNINKRYVINSIIAFFFILIIGLFFIPIFKKNLNIIKEFKKCKNDKTKTISTFKNERFQLIKSIFSTINIEDLIINIFKNFNIQSSNYFATNDIKNVLIKKYKNFLDLGSGIKGIIKNSPFYYVTVREHNIKNVSTSNTVLFPYTRYETFTDSNGRVSRELVTDYEALTAYHSEPTPFIDHYSELIYKTNFLPELHVTSNNKFYDKKILLENKEFIHQYKINDISNNIVKTKEFFTIKTQENFVNWFKNQKGDIYPFEKYLNTFIVSKDNNKKNNISDFESDIDKSNKPSKFDLKTQFKNSFIYQKTIAIHKDNDYKTNNDLKLIVSNSNMIHNSEDFDLKSAINNVFIYLKEYFEHLIKMLQLPLLVPGISREWYQENGNYLIANNFDSNLTNINEIGTYDIQNVLMQLINNNWIKFSSNKKIDRPIWVELKNFEQISNSSCISSTFVIKSYKSKVKVDYVPVAGINVGTKIIPVKYRKFYNIKETKAFIYMPFSSETTNCIVYGKPVTNLMHKSVYENKEFANAILKEKIWTNNPSWLENISNRDEFLVLIKKINAINDKFNLDLVFQINKVGLCIVLNNTNNYSKEVENKLIQFVKTFNANKFF